MAAWREGELVKATGQSSGSLEKGQHHLSYAEVKPGFIKL